MRGAVRVLGVTAGVLALFVSGPVAAAEKFAGTATDPTGAISFGAVTFTVKGGKVRNFTVEGATVTNGGCGGYKSVIVPTIPLRGGRMIGVYTPVPGVDDSIRVNGTITKGRASGTFAEGPLCELRGKFTAKRR